MNSAARRWQPAAWCALATLSLAGCASEDDPLVGSAATLDVDSCFGAEIVCDPAAVPSEELVLPEARTCNGELRGGIEREYLVPLPDLDDCESSNECTTSSALSDFALGADGVGWWLYSGKKPLLFRYDADGHMLSSTDLAEVVGEPGTILSNADLALDERGHAFVVVHTGLQIDDDTRAWFVELDPQGQPVGGATRLGPVGYLQVASAGSGEVIAGNLAKDRGRGVLAKLDPSGTRVWSQTDVRAHWDFPQDFGVSSIATDAVGQVTLTSYRAPRDGLEARGVARFDAAGNAIWDRTFELLPIAGPVQVIPATDGAVVMRVTEEAQSRGFDQASLPIPERVVHVSADGAADWAYEFVSGRPIVTAFDAATGDLYVSVFAVHIEGELAHPYLAVISEDGERCVRYALPEVDDVPAGGNSGAIEELALGWDGKLYGSTGFRRDFRIDLGVARWRLPLD